jgi:hypothetical protein
MLIESFQIQGENLVNHSLGIIPIILSANQIVIPYK